MSWDKFLLLGPLTDRTIKKYALKGWYGAKVKAKYTAEEEAKRKAKFLYLQRKKQKQVKEETRKVVRSLKRRLDEWEKELGLI